MKIKKGGNESGEGNRSRLKANMGEGSASEEGKLNRLPLSHFALRRRIKRMYSKPFGHGALEAWVGASTTKVFWMKCHNPERMSDCS